MVVGRARLRDISNGRTGVAPSNRKSSAIQATIGPPMSMQQITLLGQLILMPQTVQVGVAVNN